jgi:hypothetical protein
MGNFELPELGGECDGLIDGERELSGARELPVACDINKWQKL